MSQTLSIIRATATDAPEVSELVATAFHQLEVSCWLVPDPVQRARILPAYFRIYVDHAMAYGQVHLSASRAAAAVWFHRDTGPPPEPAAYQERLAQACGEATPRFQHLDALFDQHHPPQPHHHLAFLAVHPKWQGHGLGTALLRRHHTRLDASGQAAYLEAASARSRDLYQRHGYQVVDGPFHLPDQTPMWPMWRPPTTAASTRTTDAEARR